MIDGSSAAKRRFSHQPPVEHRGTGGNQTHRQSKPARPAYRIETYHIVATWFVVRRGAVGQLLAPSVSWGVCVAELTQAADAAAQGMPCWCRVCVGASAPPIDEGMFTPGSRPGLTVVRLLRMQRPPGANQRTAGKAGLLGLVGVVAMAKQDRTDQLVARCVKVKRGTPSEFVDLWVPEVHASYGYVAGCIANVFNSRLVAKWRGAPKAFKPLDRRNARMSCNSFGGTPLSDPNSPRTSVASDNRPRISRTASRRFSNFSPESNSASNRLRTAGVRTGMLL